MRSRTACYDAGVRRQTWLLWGLTAIGLLALARWLLPSGALQNTTAPPGLEQTLPRTSAELGPSRSSSLAAERGPNPEPDDPYAFTELKGKVLDEATRTGIPGAFVRVRRSRQTVAETIGGPDGSFTVRGLRPGLYRFEATANGYTTASLELQKLDVLEDDEAVVLYLEATGSLEGAVTDPTGVPVEGAKVCWRRHEDGFASEAIAWTETNDEGRYRFEAVPGSELIVQAHHPRFLAAEAPVLVQAQTRTRQDLRLSKGHVLVGQVRSATGPLDSARVWLFPPGPSRASLEVEQNRYGAQSDGLGRYELERPFEEVWVVAWAPGHQSQRSRIGASESQLDFTLEASATLDVRVLDAQAQPLAGVSVIASKLEHESTEGISDLEGRVVLVDLSAGEWSVRAKTPGGSDRFESTVVRAGVENTLSFDFDDRGRVLGHLLNRETKDRITEMSLVLTRPAGSVRRRFSSPSGSFVFSGLPEGSFVLIAQAEGFVPTRIEPVIVGASAVDLGAIELVPLATVHGEVSPAPGERLLVGEARSSNARGSEFFAIEPNGRFMAQLPAGTYLVEVRDGQERTLGRTQWALRPGELMRAVRLHLREF